MKKVLFLFSFLFLIIACEKEVIDIEPLFKFQTAGDGKIQFTNEARNATSYEWNFGDGTTSTEENPVHQYAKNGKYTVTLIAKNKRNTVTKVYEVTVTDAPKPLAKFSYKSLGSGTMEFTNETQGAESYIWDFGDGKTASEVNPKHGYSVNGTYEVKLTAENANGKSEVKQSVTITDSPKPEAIFTFEFGENGKVSFKNLSKNYTQLAWDFGNGTSSTEENPTVTYAYNGNYNVSLTAKNPNGEYKLIRVVKVTSLPAQTTGQLMFWTNNSGSNIKVYVEEAFVGLVTKSSRSTPACNADGFVTLTLPEGYYFFRAEEESIAATGTGSSWTGVYNVVNGQCRTFCLIR